MARAGARELTTHAQPKLMNTMEQPHSQCRCGKAQVTLSALPSARFRCHCTICQSVYAADFADVAVFRRGQVTPRAPRQIKWIRIKSITPLRRGLCRDCNDPVLAYFYGILAFMPTRTLPAIALPPVNRDIYTATRTSAVVDDVPKSSSLISAYAGLSLPFLKVLLSRGRTPTG
jgi:hypothetical protein